VRLANARTVTPGAHDHTHVAVWHFSDMTFVPVDVRSWRHAENICSQRVFRILTLCGPHQKQKTCGVSRKLAKIHLSAMGKYPAWVLD